MAKYNSLDQTSPERNFIFDYSSYNDFSSILDIRHDEKIDKYKNFTYTSSNEMPIIEKPIPEGRLSSWFRFLLSGLCFSVFVTTFPISAFFCLKKVSSLQRLVLMRLGRLQPVKGPGLVVVLPFVDKYFLVDLSPKDLHVGPCDVMTADQSLVSLELSVRYQINNVVGYVTRTKEHLEDCLTQMVRTSVVNKASGLDLDALDKDLLQSHVKVDVNSMVHSWGGEVLSVTIPSLRILKAAEPKDPLSPLINSLGALFSPPQSTAQSHNQCQMLPLGPSIIIDMPSDSLTLTGETKTSIESLKQDLTAWIQNKVRDSADWANLSTSFKVILTSDITPSLGSFLVHLHQGAVEVSEIDDTSSRANATADVVLSLDPTHLRQIMSGQIGVKEAYLTGKLKVEGDWTQLPL